MKKFNINKENRLIFQEMFPGSSDNRSERREEIDESKDENTARKLERLKEQTATYAIKTMLPAMGDPEKMKALIEENDLEDFQELLADYQDADFDDLDSWKDHFIDNFGEQEGPKIFALLKRLFGNERRTAEDYKTLAGIYLHPDQLALLKKASQKREKYDHFSYEELTQDENVRAVVRISNFYMIFKYLEPPEKVTVANHIIDGFRSRAIKSDDVIRVARDLRTNNLIDLSIIQQLKLTDEEKHKVEPIGGQKGIDRSLDMMDEEYKAYHKAQEERAGMSLPESETRKMYVQLQTPPDIQRLQTNFAAKHFTLKNFFLVEYVGRLLAFGEILDFGSNIVNAIMAKNNDDRKQILTKMVTDPFRFARIGGLAMIYENITSEHHGKPIGAGVVSHLLDIAPTDRLGRELFDESRADNADKAILEMDYRTMIELKENPEFYHELSDLHSLTAEDFEQLKIKITGPHFFDQLSRGVEITSAIFGTRTIHIDQKILQAIGNKENSDLPTNTAKQEHLIAFLDLISRKSSGVSHHDFQTSTFDNYEKSFKGIARPGLHLDHSGKLRPKIDPERLEE